MSGGVDSSMTALLMQQAGYECVGVHMQLLDEPGPDAAGARAIADKLGIPFHICDLSQLFRDKVIEPFAQGYEVGETPNPCIVCNRYLKFGALLDIATDLNCDYLATGHYARVEKDEDIGCYVARTGADASKDQSYVLYSLSQEQLSRVVLPLGDYYKPEIRKMAAQAGFHNAGKSDSQGICFVPDKDYSAYIERYRGTPSKEGDLIDSGGKVVGKHKGIIHYTIGQRKELGAHGRPVFVQSIQSAENTISIGDDESALYSANFLVRDFNWVAFSPEKTGERTDHFLSGGGLPCNIKIGYKHLQHKGSISLTEVSGIQYVKVTFDQPQRAVSPGQAAVFYNIPNDPTQQNGDTVLGGGTIDSIL